MEMGLDITGSPVRPHTGPHLLAGFPSGIRPILAVHIQGLTVAKANYKFDKRQRDLAKQKKREEKLAKKAAKKAAETPAEGGSAPPQDDLVPH